jgi:hypothetical protein
VTKRKPFVNSLQQDIRVSVSEGGSSQDQTPFQSGSILGVGRKKDQRDTDFLKEREDNTHHILPTMNSSVIHSQRAIC